MRIALRWADSRRVNGIRNSALWGKAGGRLAVLLLIAAAFAVAGGASWAEWLFS
jgi:hypothetical protein